MPWQLTTPLNVGDLDTGSYSQIKITRLTHDSVRGFLNVDLEYGNTTAGKWVPGVAPRTKQTSIFINDQDYQDLVEDSIATDGENVYEAIKRVLYAYLVTNNIISAGSLV